MTMYNVSCLIVFGLMCCGVGVMLGGLVSEMHHCFDNFDDDDEDQVGEE